MVNDFFFFSSLCPRGGGSRACWQKGAVLKNKTKQKVIGPDGLSDPWMSERTKEKKSDKEKKVTLESESQIRAIGTQRTPIRRGPRLTTGWNKSATGMNRPGGLFCDWTIGELPIDTGAGAHKWRVLRLFSLGMKSLGYTDTHRCRPSSDRNLEVAHTNVPVWPGSVMASFVHVLRTVVWRKFLSV